MEKKIGALIVTYYPDEILFKNIDSVQSQVDKILIVDNTPEESSIISDIRKSEHVEVFSFGNNQGMAKALNHGCQWFIDNEYSHALLLDQDSIIDCNVVEELSLLLDIPDVCMSSPNIICMTTDISNTTVNSYYHTVPKGLWFEREKVDNTPLEVLFNITSGSLIDLNKWREIGMFDEQLFIEAVDTEFGLRANSSNYKILISNKCTLMQRYGNQQKRSILGRDFYPTFHSPLRHFYVCRNRLLLWSRYYKVYPSFIIWDFMSLCKTFLLILVFEDNKIAKFKSMYRGYSEGIKLLLKGSK